MLAAAWVTQTCCYMQSNHSYGKLLVKTMTFKLGISAVVPLILEGCPNNRVIPNDFLGILIMVKVGRYVFTLMKHQRPTFCPKVVRRMGVGTFD